MKRLIIYVLLAVPTLTSAMTSVSDPMIAPSGNGQVIVQTPQAGTIISLHAELGQHVSKGQLLAVIEQNVDAGTQISLLNKLNAAEGEYRAAKAQFDRLKTLHSASKRDLQEAEAKYRVAKSDLGLLRHLRSENPGNRQMVTLTAPISGQISTFSFAAGDVINAAEPLLTITNVPKNASDTRVDPEIVTNVWNARVRP